MNEQQITCADCGAAIRSRDELMQACPQSVLPYGNHRIAYHQHAAMIRGESQTHGQ